MKKIMNCVLAFALLLTMAGCNTEKKDKEKKPESTIEITEMREIAELATVDCYFHNVAKSDRELNPEWYEFWEKKNMRFWVEYEGIVTIGIDVSKLRVEVSDDNVVTIMLPEAVVLDVIVSEDSLTADSFYFDPNAKRPSPEEQTEAFKQAQNEMKNAAEKNQALLANARSNAKELIKNYIKTVGEAVGVEYTIVWKYPEDLGKVSVSEKPEETTAG